MRSELQSQQESTVDCGISADENGSYQRGIHRKWCSLQRGIKKKSELTDKAEELSPPEEEVRTQDQPAPQPNPTSPLRKDAPVSTRKKLTPSLTSLANGSAKSDSHEITKPVASISEELPVTLSKLKEAWDEFAEQRKSQVGEYHLLRQEFEFQDNQVIIKLSNHVEEPLLQAIKGPLTEFLRLKLSNNRINIISEVIEVDPKKIAYTNKEKFEHLAEKNPILKELKERLGLDTDY